MSSAISAARTASVPDDKPIACGTFSDSHNSRSRPSTSGPPMKRWLSQTRVTASRMAWRSGAYCAWRSSKGTVTNIPWYMCRAGERNRAPASAQPRVSARDGALRWRQAAVQPQFRGRERQSKHDSCDDVGLRDRDASPSANLHVAGDLDRAVGRQQQHEQQTGGEIKADNRPRMAAHESP